MVDEQSVKMLKIRSELKNGTLLYIHELHATSHQKYSYHWQDSGGRLLLRWDNSPHHRELPNFPYHVHRGNSVEASFRVEVDDVLGEMKDLILGQKNKTV